MRSPEEIVSLYQQRKNDAGPLAAKMREIRDTYNGDVIVPLPEREASERIAVANLLQMGLDQMADRIASTVPDPRFLPRRGGKAEEERCRNKRKAIKGMWDYSNMGLKLYRRGRHLLGYGSTPVQIMPGFTVDAPVWQVRDPLGTYAGPAADPDDPCVPDVIFAAKRPLNWLSRRYEGMEMLGKPRDCPDDALFEVITYIDEHCKMDMVIGRSEDDPYTSAPTGKPFMVLQMLENRAGRCTAVVPGRINLDHRKGQFDSMPGMYQTQARLFALELIAVEQGVFPDEWLIARQGETPEVVRVADGRKGTVGLIKGGELRQQALQPGQMTYPTLDRLERAQRLDAGVPADFGGESASNVRTGRRGENILAATIDFTLQQAQRVLQTSMETENAIAIAIDKGYHDTAKSFYIPWNAEPDTPTDYQPSVLWDSVQNVVSYAAAGTDVNGLVISGGQRTQMGTLSKQGFMELDPIIDDVELELDRITSEALISAMTSGIQQQAASGQIPPADVARIAQLVKDNKMDLAEAMLKVQQEAQERQAAVVEEGAPEAQPGLAMPGMGAESASAPAGAEMGLGGLSELLGSLRRPQALSAPSEAPRPEAMV